MAQDEAPSNDQIKKQPAVSDKVNRMGTGSIPRLVTEFAIPSIVGMLVNAAYNVIDSIFLGQAMGQIGLSTATVAMPIMTIFMALAMLVGNGGNALAALRMGEGKPKDAERSLGNTITLSLIISVVVAICCMVPAILNPLLDISSCTEEIRPYATQFIQILALGFFLQCIGMGVNNFIRTAGAPNRALVTMVVGAVACTIFNFLFVMVLGWGVAGSALATIVGQVFSCVSVLWYFIFTKNVPIRLHWHMMKPVPRMMRTILSLGLASFFVQAAMAVVNLVINYLLVEYGSISPIGAVGALASIGVVQRVAMFTVMPLIGVAIAIQPLLGYNYGAHIYGRVRKTFWVGMGMATSIAVVMWALVHLFPNAIVGIFGVSAELTDFTVFALKVQLAVLPFIPMQMIGSNYFQATGQPLKSSILSLTRQILYLIPLLFIMPHLLPMMFPQFTGLDAIYFATPLADCLSVVTAAIFIVIEMKRLGRLERGQKDGEARGAVA